MADHLMAHHLDDFEILFTQTQQTMRELNTTIESIRHIPGYEKFMAPTGWADIVEAVQAGFPLVYLVTTQVGSLALIVDLDQQTMQTGLELVWVDEFATELLDLLLIQPGGQNILGKDYEPGALFSKPGKTATLDIFTLLGEKLIGPIAAYLREKASIGVIFIPVGRLSLLPLQAASYSRGERQICLLDEFDVAYTPSARILTLARHALKLRQKAPRRLLGVGNPLDNPAPLQYAQAELEQVSSLFATDACHLLYEHAAAKQAVLDALPSATHLHFACHGMFDFEEPLDSHLQLADGDKLSLRQIMEFRQLEQARLVVLSACQTAISEFSKLPDEAIGLPGGFFLAGVPGVVGTLWSVNDLSTALLMIKFYEVHLCGAARTGSGVLPPAQALRKAQLWLRDVTSAELTTLFDTYRQSDISPHLASLAAQQFTRYIQHDPGERPFTHPHYWAAFVFYGI
jgi:CHAT domain-containing protein